MTLLLTEGFDHQATNLNLANQFTVVSGVKAFVAGRFGGRAASLQPTNNMSQGPRLCYAPANINSGTVGFGFQINPASSSQPPGSILVCFGNTTHPTLVTITLAAATGLVTATAPVSLGTAGVSQSAMFQSGLWNFCEIQTVLDEVAGAITVQINGVNAISVANVKTTTVAPVLDLITWGFVAGNGGTGYIDDVYFCDLNGAAPFNTFLGGCHINTVFPAAPGTYAQFTPNNPNNTNWFGVSDAVMDGDLTYNTASNVGTKDTFTSAAAFLPTANILAVQPKSAVRQDDTNARQMQTYVKSGSTEQGGATYTMNQTYLYMADIYVNDPATGLPWTSAGVNALEFGYNIVE
jgi:hypothetical protein